MTDSTPPRANIVGLMRLRNHCTFVWQRDELRSQRLVEIRDNHCADCIEEARRLGYRLVGVDGKDHVP